ncbi:MAG: hypothetical protein ACYDGY_02990 [Acidimicrobiales bacterium]
MPIDEHHDTGDYRHDKSNSEDNPTLQTPAVASATEGVAPRRPSGSYPMTAMTEEAIANTEAIRVGNKGISIDSSHEDSSEDFDTFLEEDDEWPTHGPSKGIRIRLPAAILLVLLIGLGGIWGGAALQRSQGATSATSAASVFAQFRSRAGGAFSGLGGAATGASGSAVTGTLTVINGNTLYITDASGGIVKVTVSKVTTVTRDANATVAALQPGDTVVIQGTKASSGVISATSIASTAKGITPSAAGGLGGG